MKLGFNLGYAPPGTNPADLVPAVRHAEQLSRLLGSDAAGAGDVFRMMRAAEGKHRSQLIARRERLFGHDNGAHAIANFARNV